MSATNLNRIAMVLAFGGIFVAGVLTVFQIMHADLPCTPGADCAAVSSHPSGKWLGYPVAYFGLATYIVLAFIAGMRSANGVTSSRFPILLGTMISGIGTGISAYLMYTSLVVIKARCDWCIASAIIMTALLVVHVLMLKATDPENLNAADADFKLMIALGLASAVAVVGVTSLAKGDNIYVRQNDIDSMALEELVPPDAHIMGSQDAPITIVEFADLLCPTCKLGFPEIEELVTSSNGRIRLVFRHLPIPSEEHKFALPAAIIAEIASEKGRFWQYIEGVYAIEDHHVDAEALLNLATTLGLNRDEVQKRIEDSNDRAVKAVARDKAVAMSFLKVASTPTFIVFKKGGRRYSPKSPMEIKSLLETPDFN